MTKSPVLFCEEQGNTGLFHFMSHRVIRVRFRLLIKWRIATFAPAIISANMGKPAQQAGTRKEEKGAIEEQLYTRLERQNIFMRIKM